jgi:hypothetical protein
VIGAAAARTLVAQLAAAFPIPRVPEATLRLYEAELAGLADVDTAREAVRATVLGADRWPPLVRLLDEYAIAARRRARDRAETHGLPEPETVPVTPEQIQWMRDRIEHGFGNPVERPRRHSDEELARAHALAKRQQAERERRRSDLIEPTNEPTNEPPPPASRDGNAP